VSATGSKKRSKFSLPESYDGRVSEGAMYHAVRAFLSNLRQGTHSTKTRSEVSGGGKKPWRQKGTGRARQGTTRASQWRGGGVVFGPRPRSYRVDLPRRVRRLARQSALNARANDGAVFVIESLAFEKPQTTQMVSLLDKLELMGKKVLLLTSENRVATYLSGRNLGNVHVMRYSDVTAYEVLWSDALVIEEAALGGGGADAEAEQGGDDA
jgi:large subunit ribosomal protein L4